MGIADLWESLPPIYLVRLFWKRLQLGEQIEWGTVSGRGQGRVIIVSQVNGEQQILHLPMPGLLSGRRAQQRKKGAYQYFQRQFFRSLPLQHLP